jgi:uncharacterized protein (AIM24 family)
LNLALCCLKTGQAHAAREQLEVVVQSNPAHKRAWGYLGLALERLGDVEKAVHAFERGSHTHMARRLLERSEVVATAPPARAITAMGGTAEIRAAARAAFEALDADELSFSLATQAPPPKESGLWWATEPGAAAAHPSPGPTSNGVAPSPSPHERRRHTPSGGMAEAALAPHRRAEPVAPRSVADVARELRLVFPEDGVAVVDGRLALVKLKGAEPGRGFAVRLESIRSYSGSVKTEIMDRKVKLQSGRETLGGVGTPIVRLSGEGRVVLGPRAPRTLVSFLLQDEVAFVREEHLLGFDSGLEYENDRLAVGEDDGAPVVQLRGAGAVLLEFAGALAALEVKSGSGVTVRREILIGGIGRLAPRALPVGEAPCGQRGLVGFSGDGTVLVTAG